MTMLTLKLLGPIQVERDGVLVSGFRSKKAQALLGYIVAEQRVIARETLAAYFWPDETPAKGRTEVRRVLHNLSRMLPDCWQVDSKTVRFVPSNMKPCSGGFIPGVWRGEENGGTPAMLA